jgi:serine/threonine-protein kinase
LARLNLDPATWRSLNRLLDEALDVPPEKRQDWLYHLGTEHEPLKPRLRALLAHGAGGGATRALGTLPALELFSEAGDDELDEPAGRAGDTIGPYRLIRLLAEGGMGAVWLAERTDGMVQRPVAVKLPHGAWSRPGLAERMAREREILASLNHPHIARLYDAGVTTDGQPFLALEYVEGRPIDEYVRVAGLDIRATLGVFLQVTHAIAHAHARLVVHRDLKPSNILVTGEGQVKLVDFGIAKLLDEGMAQATELTHLAGQPLTLDYASPEQIAGEPLTVASDVYSQGVVLYEMLTGERPYRLRRDSRGALEDAILEGDPIRPSEAASQHLARNALRGDLDTIVLKALKRNPEERYSTANAFAEDVNRLLEGRPVIAQPDTITYRARRFVARNRVGVAAAATLLVLVSAFGVTSAFQARRVAAERDRARIEAARAERVTLLVADLFKLAEPGAARGDTITARELLDRGTERIATELERDPDTQAALYRVVGRVYGNLAQHETAVAVLERTLELQRRIQGNRTLEVAETLHRLAEQHVRRNEYQAAEERFREALTLRREPGSRAALRGGRAPDRRGLRAIARNPWGDGGGDPGGARDGHGAL